MTMKEYANDWDGARSYIADLKAEIAMLRDILSKVQQDHHDADEANERNKRLIQLYRNI